MGKQKKIELVIMAILSIPALLLAIIVIDVIGYKIVQQQPIPSYQKPEMPNLLSVCEKIIDNSLKELCISKVDNPDLSIDWMALRPTYGPDGGAFYTGYGIQEYADKLENINNASTYCEGKEDSVTSLNYCKAALVNPYFCNKMQPIIIGFMLFTDQGSDPEECFHDIAVIWEDPSFCKRAKDKDFCYLRTAAHIVSLKF